MTYDRQNKTQNDRTIALLGRPSKENYVRSLFTSMREQLSDRSKQMTYQRLYDRILFTSMWEKRFDRIPDRLLLIISNFHNILQVSTDRLLKLTLPTQVTFEDLPWFISSIKGQTLKIEVRFKF